MPTCSGCNSGAKMGKTGGYRIYAIGDLHGCIDDLTDMQARIAADLQTNPHLKPLVIYLGDYTDRGPNSRAVIENLMAANTTALPSRFLFGNHDSYIDLFLKHPDSMHGRMFHWLNPRMGGDTTLASYGVADANEQDPQTARDAFARAIPDVHRDFLRGCERAIHIGGYYFVHAGVNPGIPLAEQAEYDQIWIREPFLSSTADFGAIVVHGHSPVHQVENHGNRIAVDTGAVFGRYLSCLVLEGDAQELLTPAGRQNCPIGSGVMFG